METKKCTGKHSCGEIKPVSEFGKCNKVKDGLRNICNECRNAKEKERLTNDPEYHEKRNIRNRIWASNKYANDPEHREILKKRKRDKLTNDPEYHKTLKTRNKIWMKEKYANDLEYRENVKTRSNVRRRKRLVNDPEYALSCIIRSGLATLLGGGRDKRMEELLGCSIQYLKQHLESQFTNGMTWDNRTEKWHVHHVKYITSFKLSDIEQKKQCCHYSNLMPLWIEDHKQLHAYFHYSIGGKV